MNFIDSDWFPKNVPLQEAELIWEGREKELIKKAEKLVKEAENDIPEIPTYDVRHPSRKQAIRILERIGEILGTEQIFDGRWFECEDALVEILTERR